MPPADVAAFFDDAGVDAGPVTAAVTEFVERHTGADGEGGGRGQGGRDW